MTEKVDDPKKQNIDRYHLIFSFRIFDIPELTHLYPNIPKEQAFGRYKSNEGKQFNF